MAIRVQPALIACDNCRLPLPIRLATPGEVGTSWQCSGCGARYYGVLDIDAAQESINNVSVPPAPNPRVMVGSEIVAALHRRAPCAKPTVDSRKHPRKISTDQMIIMVDGAELPARAVDVSIGGVGCVIPIELHPGREVMLRFSELPGAPQTTGVICACDKWENGYRLGISFTR
ncbi:MAG TPA: PilZ domain-containing protein [Phycisphaerae bacterium]|nr:PilZ domain-containing protein [Phycisphaerae bacterium]HRW53864.1 PilZ domain-containing protein [Phycisphaerae bacterium]